MSARLEHANLGVRDLDEMVRFLKTAFPDFRIRGEGLNRDGTRWVHFGTDETYLALNQSWRELTQSFAPYQGLPGVNHLAYEVEDVDAVVSGSQRLDIKTRRCRTPTHIGNVCISVTEKTTTGSSWNTSPGTRQNGTTTSCLTCSDMIRDAGTTLGPYSVTGKLGEGGPASRSLW